MKVNRLVIILIAGIIAGYRLVYKIDDEFIFDEIINGFIIIVAVIALIWITVKDITDYKVSRSLKQLVPAITGALFAIAISLSIYIIKQRDNIPTIIFANFSGDFFGTSIDLRDNGTYKVTNYSFGAERFRGKYAIKDSIITLDKPGVAEVIKTNRLVIRSVSLTESTGLVLYQIDEQGKVLETATSFHVREDNRK